SPGPRPSPPAPGDTGTTRSHGRPANRGRSTAVTAGADRADPADPADAAAISSQPGRRNSASSVGHGSEAAPSPSTVANRPPPPAAVSGLSGYATRSPETLPRILR